MVKAAHTSIQLCLGKEGVFLNYKRNSNDKKKGGKKMRFSTTTKKKPRKRVPAVRPRNMEWKMREAMVKFVLMMLFNHSVFVCFANFTIPCSSLASLSRVA